MFYKIQCTYIFVIGGHDLNAISGSSSTNLIGLSILTFDMHLIYSTHAHAHKF